MNEKINNILKLSHNLNKKELIFLNQAIVSLIKTQRDVDFKKAAISFAIGDIVSFKDTNGAKVCGVLTKRNPKTLQVTTLDGYYVNIPATYLKKEEKPSRDLIRLKRKKLSFNHREQVFGKN